MGIFDPIAAALSGQSAPPAQPDSGPGVNQKNQRMTFDARRSEMLKNHMDPDVYGTPEEARASYQRKYGNRQLGPGDFAFHSPTGD